MSHFKSVFLKSLPAQALLAPVTQKLASGSRYLLFFSQCFSQTVPLQISTAHWRWIRSATLSIKPKHGCTGTPRSPTGTR